MCLRIKKRGLQQLYLKAEKVLAQSWLNMPDNLKLGPWISSYVENNISRFQMCSEPTANEFAHRPINFALSKNISIVTDQRVIAVQKRNGFFSLTTDSAQTHNATCVVNATGYFQNPFFPNWANSDLTNSKVIHYSDYKSSETLPESNHPLKVLVVGGGISAGELIMDLADTSHHITLSTRSKINFEQPKWLQLIASPFYFWLENNVALFRRFGSSKRYMAGGKIKRIIQSNRVNHIGPILGVEGEYLHHASGVEKI